MSYGWLECYTQLIIIFSKWKKSFRYSRSAVPTVFLSYTDNFILFPLLLSDRNPSGLNLTLSSECNIRAKSPSDDILLFILPHLIKIKACGASNAIRTVLKIWKGSPDGKWLPEAVGEDQRRRTRILFRDFSDFLDSVRELLSFTGQKTTDLIPEHCIEESTISLFWAIPSQIHLLVLGHYHA